MRAFLLVLASLQCVLAFAQPDADILRKRRENLEAILRIQDRRTSHDGKLISLLGDADGITRERATRAYASLQDSDALPLLIARLADPESRVQEAAAFAIGQTALLMSPEARAALESELLWKRLPDSKVPDRLIEEMGKFCTESGLADMMVRAGNVYPEPYPAGLTMAIARCAIRGIIIPDAVRYLLRRTNPPENAPWQAVYALQRIGDTPEIRTDLEHLALLRTHGDPLVRMNIATLLGKVRDTRITLEPLRRLAEFDEDWRVRVNALKALALHPIRTDPPSLLVFRRAFYDGDIQISTTALAALRTSNLIAADSVGDGAEVLRHLRYLAVNAKGNFPWPVQGEAAQTLAAILGPDAFPEGVPLAPSQRHLHADLLRALGATGAPQGLPRLLNAAGGSDPVSACGALEGLTALARRNSSDSALVAYIRTSAIRALESGDVAITGTAADMLADSILRSPAVVPALLAALNAQRLPGDLEATQEIIGALGSIGDTRAVLPLLGQIKAPDRSVATAAAHALRRLTGADYLSHLPDAPEPFFTDFDFAYLASLPETLHVTIETVRGEIRAEFYKDAAPFTIMAMVKLATQRGYYRGLTFHRIVPNFVTQGGCPRGDGWGGPGFALRSEFSLLRYDGGTIGIASAGKDTEGSQFFITHSPQPHLDGRYTVVGQVTNGMHVVRAIQRDDRIFDLTVAGLN